MKKAEKPAGFYFIETFGCQMNVYDSEVLAGYLENMGYLPTTQEEKSDILLLNTCAVRQKAEDKIFSRLGRLRTLKNTKPELIMILWGCVAQQKHVAPKVRERFGFVNLVAGPHAIKRFPKLLEKARLASQTLVDTAEEGDREGTPVKRMHGFKAWVPISHGCNNYCTYCIVPFVRGPEKSRHPQNIIREVEELIKAGYQEITLLGQNVNSYGKDLERKIDFADLLQTLDRLEGLVHLRYMTSHPRDFNEKIIRVIRDGEKICEHFHLPFQSGSNKILKLMNRGYTREYYLELTAKIKKLVPDNALTTDIIVGFPGEEEKDFEETLDIVEKVRFDAAFTFVYSPRQGTRAVSMKNQVAPALKKRRIMHLNEIQNKISLEKNQELLGTKQIVLVEGSSKTDPNTYTARTRTNKIVHFSSPKKLLGKLIALEIVEAKPWTLLGNYT